MEFEGLKVVGGRAGDGHESEGRLRSADGTDKRGSTTNSLHQHEALGAGDFVAGTDAGAEILEKVKNLKQETGEEVIYGVYDNADKGLVVKINDFLIDHSGIGLRDKSYFFHMLAVMVDAGIPVVQAVKALAYRADNKHFKRVLNTIAYSCESGSNLSDAMSRFDNIFDELEIGIVKSGEATGHLDSMLFKLSAQLDKKHDLYLKVWGAAVYPIAVLSVLVLVAVGMLVWIFPSLLSLLTDGGIGGADLPLATRILIAIQEALVDFWWLILLVIFAFYGLFSMYIHSADGAVSWDYSKLNFPILGRLLRRLYVLRFISMLGILVDAGLPVVLALKISGNALDNRVYKLKVQEVLDQVKNGKKISESLKDSEFLFPSEIVAMFAVGEQSASIAKVAEKISDQYQREIDNSLKKMTSIFEPVMILVVGVFVALLALAIMAPIFNLSGTVGGGN